MKDKDPHAWLTSAVAESGKTVPTSLTPSPEDAWQEVAAASGLTDTELLELTSERFGLGVADLAAVDAAAVSLVPERIARRFSSLPVKTDGHLLTVATARPFDLEMINVLSFTSGMHIEVELAAPDAIAGALVEAYASTDKHEAKPDVAGVEQRQDLHQASAESAIVQMTSHMITEAHGLRASDIHIEPFVGGGIIRYRVDGMLRRITTLPAPLLGQMVQHIKAMCGMNVTNHHITQDGNTELSIENRKIDIRVSVIPVVDGEKVVLRLLDSTGSAQSIEGIGLDDNDTTLLKKLVNEQSGIFIITGPTGSGKTSTLYAALRELNTVDRCLVTVEDPVEFQIGGVAQINVNESQQVTFASALRSVLRQDPDTILIGEIRDEETANMALRAALTGHFVLSTMHTRDALSSVSRLLDLGVSRTVLADSLGALAAQRLVRRLCTACRKQSVKGSETAAQLASLHPEVEQYVADGCEACGYDGYSGRAPIVELVPVGLELADGIRSSLPIAELRQHCQAGGVEFLPQKALKAISSGVTDVSEVNRVMGGDFWSQI